MTRLSSKVVRETGKVVGHRPVILIIAPGSGTREDMVGLRLKGRRTVYTLALSDVFRYAALAHGNKERMAKAQARRNGVLWRIAKRYFNNLNRL